MIRGTKRLLLAGASALAILADVAEAEATTYSVPGMYTYITPVSGEYAIEALGAAGGASYLAPPYGDGTMFVTGGPGAEVVGDVSLSAGEHLVVYVGGAGYTAIFGNAGGGGGGGSFVFAPATLLAAAGGGGRRGVLSGIWSQARHRAAPDRRGGAARRDTAPMAGQAG